MPRARRYEIDYDELHYDDIDYDDLSDDDAPDGIEYDVNLPPTFSHNLKFRLAVEEDREALEEISMYAVTPSDGSIHGHQLACVPEEYWDEFPRRMEMITKNDFFTCVVAEFVGQGFRIPDGTILGYTVWGWAEYTKDDDGGTTVKMGMLPRVFELWDKYLADSKKPTDDHEYRPRVVQRRVPPRPEHEGRRRTRVGRRREHCMWILQDMEWDCRLHPRDIEQHLIGWGCNIADRERIRLAVTWPWENTDEFERQGFDVRDYDDHSNYRVRDMYGFVQFLEMVKMRRRPRRVAEGNDNANANNNANNNVQR
ncbi:hypothetical protein C8A01DRAFT_36666 [Parachaetomium inaequale]|uniref:Uncharacterized protein n=1 Tax=Parachaetomium inaequale TaxID=2588326 RepID=A0AAN6SRI0_9PEZI|nr:hypothetical protein C8A01DRAFT_36666 [Parachaetomium inaequale]